MMLRPSSIFSFDTLSLRGWRLGDARTLCLTLLLFVAAECVAHRLASPLEERWMYWTSQAADQLMYYKQCREKGRVPPVLIAGDSTAATGVSPETFDEAAGLSKGSYNLGLLANFPVAFDASITDLILCLEGPQPRYLILSFAPTAFITTENVKTMEAGILDSPLIRAAKGEFIVGQYLALPRLRKMQREIMQVAKGEYKGLMPPRHAGFQPWAEERLTDAVTQRLRHELDEERLAKLDRCCQVASSNNTKVILIIPPVRGPDPTLDSILLDYRQRVRPICDKHNALLWDYGDRADFRVDMADDVHMVKRGAIRFSHELGKRFSAEAALQQSSLALRPGLVSE